MSSRQHVQFLVPWQGREDERELGKGMPPTRVLSTQRLEEGTEPNPRVPTTVTHGLSPDLQGVKDAVDSYIEALSKQSSTRYKTGGDWRCFVADLKTSCDWQI